VPDRDPARSDSHRRPVRRAAVIGLGRTGIAVIAHLQRAGVAVTVTDSRQDPPGRASLAQVAPEVIARLGGFDLTVLDAADEVIVSPGVSLREPIIAQALARGLPVSGDIELFARAVHAPVVGVTGTNGKSTVASLVAAMAARAGRRVLAGGNLGPPALELLQAPEPDLYVLELSSFQLDTTRSLAPCAAVVLNVTPDHLDRYDSLEGYAASKAQIYAGARCAVVNLDDPLVRVMPRAGQRVIGFSLQSDAQATYRTLHERSDTVLYRESRRVAKLGELRLSGLHNAANALAALALAEGAGLELEPSVAALCEFTGLPHRTQWIADVAGVRYIDDSKGTNVGATIAAVEGLRGPLIVIAGGDGKEQDFTPLADAFAGKVRRAVLLGRDAGRLGAALATACPSERAEDMPDAVRRAARIALPGDTVLLSPACASLDMFRDYAHRGEVFATAVRELAR